MVHVRKFIDWQGKDERGEPVDVVVVSLDFEHRRLGLGLALNRKTGEATVRLGASLLQAVQIMEQWIGVPDEAVDAKALELGFSFSHRVKS